MLCVNRPGYSLVDVRILENFCHHPNSTYIRLSDVCDTPQLLPSPQWSYDHSIWLFHGHASVGGKHCTCQMTVLLGASDLHIASALDNAGDMLRSPSTAYHPRLTRSPYPRSLHHHSSAAKPRDGVLSSNRVVWPPGHPTFGPPAQFSVDWIE
jgi:hypothetical protein